MNSRYILLISSVAKLHKISKAESGANSARVPKAVTTTTPPDLQVYPNYSCRLPLELIFRFSAASSTFLPSVIMSYYFTIVGTRDNPLFELEFGTSKLGGDGTARFRDEAKYMNQFIIHAALDMVEEIQWANKDLYAPPPPHPISPHVSIGQPSSVTSLSHTLTISLLSLLTQHYECIRAY